MANLIKLKRSAVPGKAPVVGDLELGELAFNSYDGKLYAKKDNGTESIVELSGGSVSDGDKGDITVSSNGSTWTVDDGAITSSKIANGTIVNNDINASAAIAGTKISPDFGSQDVGTTGRLLLGTSTAPTQGNGQFSQAIVQGNTFGAGGGQLSVQSTVAPGSFVTNDFIGGMYFGANTGRDYCSVLGYADGNSVGSALATRLEFGTTSSGQSSPTTRMRIDSRGNLFIGTSANSTIWSNANTFYPHGYIGTNGSFGMDIVGNGYRNTSSGWTSLNVNGQTGRTSISLRPEGNIIFGADALSTGTGPTERARITSGGAFLVGKTTENTLAATGFEARSNSQVFVTADNVAGLAVNRLTADGTVILIYQDTTLEGNISVSGTTVSYNGAHLSRWSQIPGIDPHDKDARPEILRGTVMSNLDEMCDWIEPDSGEAQANEQLNKTKISDVECDKNVAGVFQSWDDDDDTWVNDFYLAMTGDFVIRIAAGVSVERGDLLISAGDGTAKPQADDLIRSSTIAKITSTTVSHVHPDGSFCVPCVLMAC